MSRTLPTDAPPLGAVLIDRVNGHRVTVTEIFSAPPYGAMMVEWWGYNATFDRDGPKGQAFTLRDWRDRWEIQP